MTLPISDRVNPIHRNLIENVRFGQVWGHLPPEDGLLDFFLKIKNYTKVENILEFGTNFGFSSSYQLTLFPEANIVSYDPREWHCEEALYEHSREVNNMTCPAWMLNRLAYGDRFYFRNTFSKNARVREKSNHFDYCFVDGDHSLEGTIYDIETAKLLGIKYFFVDNMRPGDPSTVEIQDAIAHFGDEITELDRYTYTSEYPRKKDNEILYIQDDIVLFEFKNL